jgi:hypothetical protein
MNFAQCQTGEHISYMTVKGNVNLAEAERNEGTWENTLF